jgi:hypothetical protein
MAIGRITGPMLQSNLERQGVDIAIDGNVIYADVTNRRAGINTSSPQYTLDVNGNAHIGNLYVLGNTLTSDTGRINLGNAGNLVITGGSNDYVLTTDGFGNIFWSNVSTVISATGLSGNIITLGANTVNAFVSNAVTLTTTTKVTDAIAELNYVLGKLVPTPPPNFPGVSTLALSSATTTALMCNFTQTDNSGWANLSIAGGTSVAAIRASSYAAGTITSVGPGNSGTVTAYLNGNVAGSHTLTGVSGDNGTYGNLIIASVQDYHNVLSSVTAGFWYSFNSSVAGSNIPAGWNRVHIADTATNANTNVVTWYYDSSTPGTPAFTATSITLTSNVVTYSSTIPHFTGSAGFTLLGNVSALSGDMYPNSSTLLSGSAGGAFQAPTSVTYSTAGVTTPLSRNLYVSSGNVKYTTTANIVAAGFGSSSTGPTVMVNNSYNTGTATYNPGVTVLYKNGTGNQIEETNITVAASVGSGSGNAYRIVDPGSGDTPAYTGSESVWNSTTTPLQTYSATVVGSGPQGVLKFNQTNYSTGYLPIGPDLSGQGSSQYFTFKFQRTALSKFNIAYTGSIAGLWVALPGSTIDSTSTLNGWLNVGAPYAGSGIPGANSGAGGNGSNGCSFGGSATFNSSGTYSVTANFGTISSSSTATNEIYVRVKLTSGQSLTALSIQVATN